jgi:hypothetical protein
MALVESLIGEQSYNEATVSGSTDVIMNGVAVPASASTGSGAFQFLLGPGFIVAYGGYSGTSLLRFAPAPAP